MSIQDQANVTDKGTEKMRRAPVPGGELEYEVRGEGEPVLLIHGSHIARSCRSWRSPRWQTTA